MKLVYTLLLIITMTCAFAAPNNFRATDNKKPTLEEIITDVKANGEPVFFVTGRGYELSVDGKKRVERPDKIRVVMANETYAVIDGVLVKRSRYFVNPDEYINDLKSEIEKLDSKIQPYNKGGLVRVNKRYMSLNKEKNKLDDELRNAEYILKSFKKDRDDKLSQSNTELKQDLEKARKLLKEHNIEDKTKKRVNYYRLRGKERIDFHCSVINQLCDSINKDDLNLCRELVSDQANFDFPLIHIPSSVNGPMGLLAIFKRMRASFPDLKLSISSMISDDHSVAVNWNCYGRFSGKIPFAGVAPNGREISTNFMNFYSFDNDGKIDSVTSAGGFTQIFKTLGAISPIDPVHNKTPKNIQSILEPIKPNSVEGDLEIYKMWDENGNWLFDKSSLKVAWDFVRMVNAGKNLTVNMTKEQFEIVKDGEKYQVKWPDGEIDTVNQARLVGIISEWFISYDLNLKITTTKESNSAGGDNNNDSSDSSMTKYKSRTENLSHTEIEKIVADTKNYLATGDKQISYSRAGTGGQQSTVDEILENLKNKYRLPIRFRLKTNFETSIPGIVSAETFSETRSALAESSVKEYPEAYAFALSYLESIFASSILGVVHQGNYKNNTDNNVVYHFYAGLNYDGQPYGVKITAQLHKKDNRQILYIDPYELVVLPITLEDDPNRKFIKFKDLFEVFKPEDEISNHECPNSLVPTT